MPDHPATPRESVSFIDGRDALAFVIIRPGSVEGSVSIEAAAKGMSKLAAAHVLRHVAAEFEKGSDEFPTPETEPDPRPDGGV